MIFNADLHRLHENNINLTFSFKKWSKCPVNNGRMNHHVAIRCTFSIIYVETDTR